MNGRYCLGRGCCRRRCILIGVGVLAFRRCGFRCRFCGYGRLGVLRQYFYRRRGGFGRCRFFWRFCILFRRGFFLAGRFCFLFVFLYLLGLFRRGFMLVNRMAFRAFLPDQLGLAGRRGHGWLRCILNRYGRCRRRRLDLVERVQVHLDGRLAACGMAVESKGGGGRRAPCEQQGGQDMGSAYGAEPRCGKIIHSSLITHRSVMIKTKLLP